MLLKYNILDDLVKKKAIENAVAIVTSEKPWLVSSIRDSNCFFVSRWTNLKDQQHLIESNWTSTNPWLTEIMQMPLLDLLLAQIETPQHLTRCKWTDPWQRSVTARLHWLLWQQVFKPSHRDEIWRYVCEA